MCVLPLALGEADALRAASELERATNLLRTFNATPQRVEQARATATAPPPS
jgi:hypothetical protein